MKKTFLIALTLGFMPPVSVLAADEYPAEFFHNALGRLHSAVPPAEVLEEWVSNIMYKNAKLGDFLGGSKYYVDPKVAYFGQVLADVERQLRALCEGTKKVTALSDAADLVDNHDKRRALLNAIRLINDRFNMMIIAKTGVGDGIILILNDILKRKSSFEEPRKQRCEEWLAEICQFFRSEGLFDRFAGVGTSKI